MIEDLQPTDRSPAAPTICPIRLPRSWMRRCAPARLRAAAADPGRAFVAAYTIVKQAEYEVFLQVISSWEREHLLLNV
jgi:glutamine synthetase